MPGSNKPRPARFGLRTGRPRVPDEWKEDLDPEADGVDLTPEPSTITVQGERSVFDWTPELRRKYATVVDILTKDFGLRVREVPINGERSTSDLPRVKFKTALGIIGVKKEGIAFDEWVDLLYLDDPILRQNPILKNMAINRARVALHRLYKDGKVRKEYDAEGRLILKLKYP